MNTPFTLSPSERLALILQASDPNEAPEQRIAAEMLLSFSDPAATAKRVAAIHAEARETVEKIPPYRSERIKFIQNLQAVAGDCFARATTLADKEYVTEFESEALSYLKWIDEHRLSDMTGRDIRDGEVVGFLDGKTGKVAGTVQVGWDGSRMTTTNFSDYMLDTFATSNLEQIRSFCSGFVALES